jgi:hypothetical protein
VLHYDFGITDTLPLMSVFATHACEPLFPQQLPPTWMTDSHDSAYAFIGQMKKIME